VRPLRVRQTFSQTEERFMNQRIVSGLTLLAGIAIGATAIQGLHAQAKPPTYASSPFGK